MPLPDRIDYTPPADFPKSRAPWQLSRERAAVLVHDLQRYFVQPFEENTPALSGALDATASILEAARAAEVPVIYTAQVGQQDLAARGLQADLWGPGMAADRSHTDIVEAVAPAPEEPVLTKHRYSAFARSDLGERLVAGGRDQLVIVGVYAHIGVTATVLDAFQREVKPFVVGDAVADFSLDTHLAALEHIADCCGVVTSSSEVVTAFTDAGATAGAAVPADPVPGAAPDLRAALTGLLSDAVVQEAFGDPERDLFELGLDSVRAFEMLDLLAADGLEIDFGEFTRQPNVAFLRQQRAALAGS